MDLQPGERVIFEGHPSWRASLSFFVKAVLLAAVAGVVAALVSALGKGGPSGPVIGLVVVGVLAVAVLVNFVHRFSTVYAITSQRLYIQRGILSRRLQQTRVDRVQNVNTDQGPLERLLHVGTVDFDTAGTDDAEFRFAGVLEPSEIVRAVHDAQAHADAAAP